LTIEKPLVVNGIPFVAIEVATDPSVIQFDPSAIGFDPSGIGFDPSEIGFDPTEIARDPSPVRSTRSSTVLVALPR